MSSAETMLRTARRFAVRTEGAVLFLAVLFILGVVADEIFYPTPSLERPATLREFTEFSASMFSWGLATRQQRLRIPTMSLSAATGLIFFCHNLTEGFVGPSPIQTIHFFQPKGFIGPTITLLFALAGLSLLVSLWRHKHDPDYAF